MPDNTVTYVLNLTGNLPEKLRKITIVNDEQLVTWVKVEQKVLAAQNTMNGMGRSIGSMNMQISALRAQKEWIPASNRAAIKSANREIEKLTAEVNKLESLNGNKLKNWFGQLKSSIPILNSITNPLALITAGTFAATRAIKSSTSAYMEESVQVSKLQQVMRNTMNARNEDVQSILKLTSAQQKLGVIGDEVQLSGAQELSTYISRKESLEKLIPAMNDMLAQQYGLNATQEQATTIGMMMGKVMMGQTEALSRYGYKFDDAQKNILKTGTEAQRAAVLLEIINEAVGGVNEALAQTPEGALKRQANNLGDLQERLGKIVVEVKSIFAPVVTFIGDFFDKVIEFFEKNKAVINAFAQVASKTLIKVFGAVFSIINSVTSRISKFIEMLKQGNPVIVGITTVIGSLITAMIAYNAWIGIVSLVTKVWAGIQLIFNAIMYANPIGLVILAVVSLAAAITAVIYKTKGWGETWKNLGAFMKLVWQGAMTELKLGWLEFEDFFMTAIEALQRAWYKLQSLWDKEGAAAGLAEVQDKQFERAEQIAEARNKLDEINKERKNIDIWQVKIDDSKKFSDITKGIKNKLGIGNLESGISQATIPGMNTSTAPGGYTSDDSNTKSGIAESIATGGTRNTSINIQFKNMVEQIVFDGNLSEKRTDLEREVTSILARVLGMAQSTA